MNKKQLGIVGIFTAAALALSGLLVPANAAGKNLVIWSDAQRGTAIREAAASWAKANGVTLTVVIKDLGKVRDDLITAAPKGLGPDILVGPHDWVGQLAASGVLSRMTSINKSAFASSAIAGFSYKGLLYGVPYNIENVAMFVNTKLSPTNPKTFAELEATWASLKAAGTAKVGIEIPYGDPYHHTPIFTALGGYVFKNGPAGWNVKDIGINSKAFAANASKLDGMYTSGLLSKSSNYDFVQWYAGKAPFMITGPWNLGNVKKSGIAYAIAPVPAYNGTAATPWVGVNGFMLSAFAKNKVVARSFLTNVVSSDDFQVALFKVGDRMPALLSAAANPAVASNADFLAFGQYGSTGVPMPNIPQMSAVWTDWGNAFKTVADGKSTAAEAFKLAAANIKKAVG
jgi:maltose-binding protein MalE